MITNKDIILVTGGAGFIGSNFIHHYLNHDYGQIINLDKLTYAGNLTNLAPFIDDPRYQFIEGDITNASLLKEILIRNKPTAIIHFAAESHVDRSISGPDCFINTNINGSFQLLQAAHDFWQQLNNTEDFRFLHVSTDEVYGSLTATAAAFTEQSPYQPNSPYAASKAASDHLARAYHHTYGLPVIISHCSNNYGRFQFPEKLIPLMILNGLKKQPLPIYGDGSNVRDWLHVEDHCRALVCLLNNGRVGEVYNIGGETQLSNLNLVKEICLLLDEYDRSVKHESLMTFVEDRPGHDQRYAVNIDKIRDQLNWSPTIHFSDGLQMTVNWYLENPQWIAEINSGEYQQWLSRQYEKRGQ